MNTRFSAGTILGWAMRVVIAVSCCAPLFFAAQEANPTAPAPTAPVTRASTLNAPQGPRPNKTGIPVAN